MSRIPPIPAVPLPAPAQSADPVTLVRIEDRSELERTLLALLPLIRRLMGRVLGPGLVDDATQEALIALSQALPRFEGRCSLPTFARRISLRVAYRHFGRGRTEVTFDPETLAYGGPAADAVLAERQALARLQRCLAKLPEKRRTAFVLCGLEGLSAQEAAETAGTSPGSMRARYMHARSELSRMLSTLPEEMRDG